MTLCSVQKSELVRVKHIIGQLGLVNMNMEKICVGSDFVQSDNVMRDMCWLRLDFVQSDNVIHVLYYMRILYR